MKETHHGQITTTPRRQEVGKTLKEKRDAKRAKQQDKKPHER